MLSCKPKMNKERTKVEPPTVRVTRAWANALGRSRGLPCHIFRLRHTVLSCKPKMNKESTKVEPPTVHVTRAPAKDVGTLCGQVQKPRVASDENKHSILTTSSLQKKRTAALANVTNVLCENSYMTCLAGGKLQKNKHERTIPTRKNLKVVPMIPAETHHGQENVKAKIAAKEVPCTAATSLKAKKRSTSSINNTSFLKNSLAPPLNMKPNAILPFRPSLARSDVFVPCKATLPKIELPLSHVTIPQAPCGMDMGISPSPSDGRSLSMLESMSSCDSCPEVEYLDENDVASLVSIERKTSTNLHISDPMKAAGSVCKREILAEMEMDKVVIIDDNYTDPQLCATIACDIYKHLRASEAKKWPAADFMEKVQKYINPSIRAILIDWLVEVAENYGLVPDTLYLTVNYIDRYLSGNTMNKEHLQLLGVACMMIASKYEEICAPHVEEFCYITDVRYFKDEVLQMESTVLNFLKFEMTAVTTKCFLRRFVRAAQVTTDVPSMQFECMANYIAELSLLEYHMLRFAPSITAASAVFLAKFMLSPSQRPWNSTLRHYTLYEPCDLHDCVKALHDLCLNSSASSLPAIREKYCQPKYRFAAKKYCPPSIASEYFHNTQPRL